MAQKIQMQIQSVLDVMEEVLKWSFKEWETLFYNLNNIVPTVGVRDML